MKLTLPYPPTINHYWGQRGRRKFLTQRAKDYREAVAVQVAEMKCHYGEQRLSIDIDLWMPDRRKRDIDNVQKPLIDALMHAGAFHDDEQIDRLLTQRNGVEKGGRCEVTLMAIDGDLWRKIL